MAAVTSVTPTTSSSNTTSYASAAFTPAADDLLVVFVAKNGSANAGTMTSSVGGQTFTRIGGDVNVAGIEAFIATARSTAVSQTVTYDCTGDGATACNIWIARVSAMPSGSAGISAVRQFKTAVESGTTTTVALDAAADSANVCLGGCANSANPAAVTHPSSWTEHTDTGIGSPNTGLEGCSRIGETSSSIQWTTGGTTAVAIVVELSTVAADTGPAEHVAITAAANTPSAALTFGAGNATGTAVAENAVAAAGLSSQIAAATTTTYDASLAVTFPAEVTAATSTAYDATVETFTGGPETDADAEHIAVAASASAPTVTAGVSAEATVTTATVFDASTTLTVTTATATVVATVYDATVDAVIPSEGNITTTGSLRLISTPA